MSVPAEITINDLTSGTVGGTGVFDKLMTSLRAHLEAEFREGRIKGTEYAQVYLGGMQEVLRASSEFLLQKSKVALEALVLEQAVLRAQIEVEKIGLERDILQATLPKVQAETALIQQQLLNAIQDRLVSVAQECKLKAEFDLTNATILKVNQEETILAQKFLTERAQTQSVGVDPLSVIGKQNALYTAQTAGFARDAEHKAAQLMISTWQVRRTTDEGTQANAGNALDDATIKRAVDKMLTGVGA